jgi:hypothetical protein
MGAAALPTHTCVRHAHDKEDVAVGLGVCGGRVASIQQGVLQEQAGVRNLERF